MTQPAARMTEREFLDRSLALLKDRLPPGWEVAVGPARSDGPDLLVDLVSPGGDSAGLLIQTKPSSPRLRDLASVSEYLRLWRHRFPQATPVLLARYLGPTVRDRLTEEGISYLDLTGNIRLVVEQPAVFLADRGADSDPWRGPGRPSGDLKGPVAAAIVRTLIDVDREWRITGLIAAAGTSTGSTYRVVELLEQERILERDGSQIYVPDWSALLRRWSRDYSFVHSNTTTRWLAPRGLDHLQGVLTAGQVPYVVTGSIAAAEWAPYAPVRAAMIFTPDPSAAAAEWNLRPAETEANVLLAEPSGNYAFTRPVIAQNWHGVLAAPAQVTADLLTGPGRNPSEGEELLGWMTRNESSWRW
ncbi:hypothetical protein [Kribbella sp. CA-293567]|uniref:hypothetical protein n=1 Tax=Kribbella sp. CA-293567 TaxID=3002436 RepID=UPI0022DD46A9|nr:hypothetical protein [Kribbella sp. CA-293567]WBQ05450.1 hypothetical protein OX958_01305 [Kribbella sp. CA-293567]